VDQLAKLAGLLEAGLLTTEEFDRYLTAPQTVVPHTKMIFPGLKDEQKRKNVIAYLEQFGPDGEKKQ
jgi:cytochrome c